MSGTSVHTKFPARTGRMGVVRNAKSVLRSTDPSVSRASIIHALRTLYRHNELNFDNEKDVKLIVRKLHVNDNFPFDIACTLITVDNVRNAKSE